ncbi:Hypothetical protein, putative [Bodo saltans]|uniref:Uncharacterized protein n=1 Tax=Bodo saltans TaxID=75058 RepID=A0A0S4JHC9_BODSA|nr:Hypothetical protein, putative [Bodo saltans]|eukprot:CUG88414.1 Hypothetical protein, putative [Bodo saltans]
MHGHIFKTPLYNALLYCQIFSTAALTNIRPLWFGALPLEAGYVRRVSAMLFLAGKLEIMNEKKASVLLCMNKSLSNKLEIVLCLFFSIPTQKIKRIMTRNSCRCYGGAQNSAESSWGQD